MHSRVVVIWLNYHATVICFDVLSLAGNGCGRLRRSASIAYFNQKLATKKRDTSSLLLAKSLDTVSFSHALDSRTCETLERIRAAVMRLVIASISQMASESADSAEAEHMDATFVTELDLVLTSRTFNRGMRWNCITTGAGFNVIESPGGDLPKNF